MVSPPAQKTNAGGLVGVTTAATAHKSKAAPVAALRPLSIQPAYLSFSSNASSA
jgi:flavin reductase (DIM6/NTAB) family NADH-FMN oxidoreductase RutF